MGNFYSNSSDRTSQRFFPNVCKRFVNGTVATIEEDSFVENSLYRSPRFIILSQTERARGANLVNPF